MIRLRLVFHGRVQGVGFRAFVLRHARELGVGGTVWNRADGGVEVEAEGTRDALALLLDALREGPAAARVTKLDTQWDEGAARHRGFSVGPTGRT